MYKKKLFNRLSCVALSVVTIASLSSCRSNTESAANEEVKDTAAIACPAATYTIEESMQDSFALLAPSKKSSMSLIEALANRRTVRSFAETALSDQQISDLLWCACGVNREDGKLTAPTACNAQEIDVYLFTPKAIYFYQKASHSLKLFKEGDFREKAGNQAFFRTAPIAIALVGDFDKMGRFDEEGKQFYSATDVGYVSQDIYLYCAAAGLATVACGNIDRPAITELLGLTNAKPLLSHPVGIEQ